MVTFRWLAHTIKRLTMPRPYRARKMLSVNKTEGVFFSGRNDSNFLSVPFLSHRILLPISSTSLLFIRVSLFLFRFREAYRFKSFPLLFFVLVY